MSYLEVSDIQAWLQSGKYRVTSVDAALETAAVTYVFGEIAQRYDTSSWTNGANTPDLVITILAMQVASYELRRAVSEDDGRATYADYLDQRSCKMVESIVTGAVALAGQVTSNTVLGDGPAFFPDFGAELRNPTDSTYAPLYFRMSDVF